MTKEQHEANRKRWDAGSEQWARSADSRGLWRRCPSEPELVLSSKELEHLSNVRGKSVAVLGSGDNQVVFALAGQHKDIRVPLDPIGLHQCRTHIRVQHIGNG